MLGRQDLRSRRDLLRTCKRKRRVLQKLTLLHLDALDRFVPYGSGTLLDELVSLDTDVKDFSTLDA